MDCFVASLLAMTVAKAALTSSPARASRGGVPSPHQTKPGSDHRTRQMPWRRAQRHPGLLGRREYVNVGRTQGRIVHRTHADEPYGGAGLRIVAPDGDFADWTARDALALAASRRCIDDLWLGRDMLDPVRFIHRIERVDGAGLPLAPGAVASVHDHRLAGQAIADMSACASTFHGRSPLMLARPHIAEQEAGHLALLDFLAAFGDAVAAVVAVDVFERLVA